LNSCAEVVIPLKKGICGKENKLYKQV